MRKGSKDCFTHTFTIAAMCVLLALSIYIPSVSAVPISGRSTSTAINSLSYGDNTVPYGKSPTTGLDSAAAAYKPIVTTMSNSPEARSHWNMSEADVVYEAVYSAPAHTRYTLVFNDNMPELVGSLRSARVYAASIRQEWDCPFVYWGYQALQGTSVADYFKAQRVDAAMQLDGHNQKFADVLFRTTGQYTRAAPHNAAANLAVISANHYPNYTPRTHAYKFTDTAPTGFDSAIAINVNYGEDYNPTYTYNESMGIYDRSYNGQPEIDGYTGKRISATNVIVQRAKLSFFNNASARPVYQLTGEGLADLFIGGRHVQGKWVRNSENTRTVFIDFMGNEIPLMPGKTFIQIVANTLDYTYTRSDGTVITNTFDERKLTDVEVAPVNIDNSELENVGE